MRTERVHDWMTTHLVVVDAETTLPEAARLLEQRMVRRLPVVENGRLAGILTYGDIRNAGPSDATSLDIWEMKHLLNKIKVKEIMTQAPITVTPETSIGEAAQLMLTHKIGGLLVLNAQAELIGIITESDIFRMVAQDWAKKQAEESAPFAHYG